MENKVYFTEFRLDNERKVRVYYASPKMREIKISRLLKDYPHLSESDIVREGFEKM